MAMMMMEVSHLFKGLGALFTAVVVHCLFRLHRSRKDAQKYPPLAPSGMWKTVQKLSGDDFPWFLLKTAETLGTRIFRLNLPIPGTPMVVVVGQGDLAREILQDKGSFKPGLYEDFINVTISPSIFTSNGPFWHSRRKGVATAFAANQVQRMNAVAVEVADEWIEKTLRPLAAANRGFNVAEEMTQVLLLSICQTAFQYPIASEELEQFKRELGLALREFLLKTSANPLRKFFGLFLPDRRRAHLAARRMQDLALRMVQAYRRLPPLALIKGTIMEAIMNNPCYENDSQRAADVTTYLVAGHDTTAYSISWILLELAKNPPLQAQLRRDLAAHSGNGNATCATLKNFIREGLRLHPVAAGGSIRQLGRQFTTPGGQVLPKGSIVFLPFILPLRDPTIFGETVDQYQPSRWEDATEEMNAAFFPFSMGRQNCVGQPLANAELQSIIPRIVSQFELTVESPGTTEYFLTLKPANCILKATPLQQK